MEKKHLAMGVGGLIGATVAWKLMTRASTVPFESAADEIHHADNSNFVVIDGVKVHFQEFGDSNDPTLLLIHGYTASTFVWKTVAPEFA